MPLYSFTYSIPYLIYALLLIVLTWNEMKQRVGKQTVRKWCIATFVLFYGFRGFVSYDWYNYYPMFEEIEPLFNIANQKWVFIVGDENGFGAMEPGYILYASIIKAIWPNWHFFVLVSTLIDIWVIDKFIRRFSPFYAFPILMFLVFSMGLEFNVLRNAKAIMVFFLSFDAIYKKKWLPLIVYTLIGVSLHSSYLIYIPFYFIGTKDFGKKVWWIIFLIINVIYWLQIPVVSTIVLPLVSSLGGDYAMKVEAYSNNVESSAVVGFSLGYIIRFITFVLVACNYRKILAFNKDLILILNIYLLYIITAIGMTDFMVLWSRMEVSLGFSMWILYPILGMLYHNKKRLLFLCYIFSYSILRVGMETSNIMADYENILWGASDYDTRVATHFSYGDEIAN